MGVRSILALAVSLVACCGTSGQNIRKEEKPTVEKIRARHLRYAAGAIPAYFSAGFEARALKYQKTMIACQRWYDQQVGKHADLTLAVLNKEDWESVSEPNDPYPMPYGKSLRGPVVVLPARFEDFPNSADFTDDVELLVENISYHELGHIYAHFLGMETDDALLAEIYANLFMVAFVRTHRSDMIFFLQGPPANVPPQRYKSLEDLQYLGGDTGMTNYGWFQFQVYRLADVLLEGKSLLQVLNQLKKAFHDPTRRPFSDVAAKLESIHPGLAKEMGSLWKPTTIPDAQPKPCKKGASSDKDSDLVVLNLSAKTVKVISGKDAPVVVSPNSWYTFSGHAEGAVQIDTGTCFVFADEPSIARIHAK
jgi:hypothetical protein